VPLSPINAKAVGAEFENEKISAITVQDQIGQSTIQTSGAALCEHRWAFGRISWVKISSKSGKKASSSRQRRSFDV